MSPGTKDAKKIGYGRGKKREQFADDEDKTLYNACQDLHEKKTDLSVSLWSFPLLTLVILTTRIDGKGALVLWFKCSDLS